MSSSFSDRLRNLASPGKQGSDIKQFSNSESWRPRMEIGEDGGVVVSTPRPIGQTNSEIEILSEFDLNSDDWDICSARKSKWQSHDGSWLEAYRITIRPRDSVYMQDKADFEKLVDEISRWKPKKTSEKITGDLAYVFAPSDQQIGKKANGEGTEHSISRILKGTSGGVERLQELRKIGRKIGTVVIALPGDHVEGNVSQGGKLQSSYASDLGLTEQTRVARRLLISQVKAFAEVAERVVVIVVNGNHDEVTRQVIADPADGWNVEIASSVQDACAENSNLSHVEFRYPDSGHQTLSVSICGTTIGLFHGHQSGKDVTKYLSGQAAGQTALGMADIWISGHFHHFKIMDIGNRLWIQAPTTDPGSEWFRDRHGLDSPPGVLSLVIGNGYDPRKDISIISTTLD